VSADLLRGVAGFVFMDDIGDVLGAQEVFGARLLVVLV